MTFTVVPSVDVAGGRAVRLADHGDDLPATGHGDPRDAALAWQAGGAEWIHLVDLDAATGRGSNATLLATVIGDLDVDVELAGGIQDDVSLARALASGCTRISLSTAALVDPVWCARAIATHGDRVAVSLDVRVVRGSRGGAPDHRLAARGGTSTDADLWETLAWLDRAGCARYVLTDVDRDGQLSGPNVELYRAVASATPAAVIASGGIAAIEDLVALAGIAATRGNLEGSIVGAALQTGRFTLPDALAAVRRAAPHEHSPPRPRSTRAPGVPADTGEDESTPRI